MQRKTYHSCTPGVETKSIQLDVFTIGINKTVPMVIAWPSGFELIDFSGNNPLCIAVASNIRYLTVISLANARWIRKGNSHGYHM